MSAVRGLKKNEMIYFEKVVYLEKINGISGMRVSVTELLRHVCSSWIKKK
jgi:ribosomal protein L5